MSRYHLAASLLKSSLHEIEAGNEYRSFSFPTLAAAIAARNLALLASGNPMSPGPRRLNVNQEWTTPANNGVYTITRMI